MKRQLGMTLVEFVMVTMLMSIIAIVVSRVYMQGLITQQTVAETTDAVWQGQVALQRMVRDIRQVRSAVDVSTMSTTQFTFTDINATAISYTRSGTTLMRNGIALADGVSALTFAYRDKNNGTVATNTNLAYVSISLTITQNNSNYSLTTAVYLRDLSS